MEWVLALSLCAHGFLPHLKRLGAPYPIIDRLHEVAAKAEEILCESMERQKALSLLEPITNRRLEIISEPLSQWGIKKPDEFFVIFQWEKSREERTFTRKIINLDIGVKSVLSQTRTGDEQKPVNPLDYAASE